MKRFAAVLTVFLATAPAQAADETTTDMPLYQPASASLEGTLTSAGSNTLKEVMEAWGAGFTALHPGVEKKFEALGSQTAPPALTEGRVLIAPMSREMTKGEKSAFEAAFGYKPTEITVALDALAVYVHKDNPVFGLAMGQLDQIFSSSHLCGGKPITEWNELAVGTRTFGTIKVHGRNTVSGTYEYFRETALCGGAFRQDYVEHEDSEAVINAVAADMEAIGFAGLGYNRDDVRPIALARGSDPQYVRFFPIYVEKFADSDDPARRFAYVLDGRYPLSRPLFLYVNKAPGEALPELVRAFLDYVLSDQGQAVVQEIGYVPLPARTIRRERRKLEADYRPRRWWFE